MRVRHSDSVRDRALAAPAQHDAAFDRPQLTDQSIPAAHAMLHQALRDGDRQLGRSCGTGVDVNVAIDIAALKENAVQSPAHTVADLRFHTHPTQLPNQTSQARKT